MGLIWVLNWDLNIDSWMLWVTGPPWFELEKSYDQNVLPNQCDTRKADLKLRQVGWAFVTPSWKAPFPVFSTHQKKKSLPRGTHKGNVFRASLFLPENVICHIFFIGLSCFTALTDPLNKGPISITDLFQMPLRNFHALNEYLHFLYNGLF